MDEVIDKLLTVMDTTADPTDEASVAVAARRLDILLAARSQITQWIEDLEQHLIDTMELDEMDLPGIGHLQRRYTKRQTWQNEHSGDRFREDLTTAVVNQVALDVATGELDPVKRNIARAAIGELMGAIYAPSAVKAGPGRKLGIRMDEYKQTTEVPKVTLVGVPDEQ